MSSSVCFPFCHDKLGVAGLLLADWTEQHVHLLQFGFLNVANNACRSILVVVGGIIKYNSSMIL